VTPGVGDTPAQAKALRKLGFTPEEHHPENAPLGYRPQDEKPHRVGSTHRAIAWVCAILTLGYMLPWAIAAQRDKSNTGAIGILTLLLGWSLIGWVIALVMACQAERA
jgi:hypothetical protein